MHSVGLRFDVQITGLITTRCNRTVG